MSAFGGKADVADFMSTRPRQLSVTELLELRAKVDEELRRRGVVRSSNVTGDYAEFLFCNALGWQAERNSSAHIDAVDPADGNKYQIKARCITPWNVSRELGALRDLPDRHFDYLAGILFDESYRIKRAVLVPHELVFENSERRYVKRSNSRKFFLTDKVMRSPGVKDVTQDLVAWMETTPLLQSPANAARLLGSIGDANEGELTEFDSTE
jgi:hypothetical protein